MSITGRRGVGLPIILLHDSEGGIVTVETRVGEVYRGVLDEAEDNMNLILKEATKTDVHGRESRVELVYIKGTQVNFLILPDMLKRAPIFKRIKVWKKYKGNIPVVGAGAMRGQAAAIMQAQGRGGRGRGGRGFGGRGDFGGGRGDGPGGRGGFMPRGPPMGMGGPPFGGPRPPFPPMMGGPHPPMGGPMGGPPHRPY